MKTVSIIGAKSPICTLTVSQFLKAASKRCKGEKKTRKDSNKKEIRVQEKKRLTFVLFLYRPLWQSLMRDNETPGYARLS